MNNFKKILRAKTSVILFSAFIALITVNLYSADPTPDIIIYGNEKCGYCKETIKWLESQSFKFVYRDVELYGTNQEEMFGKLKRAGFTTTAYFPVIDVRGQILMKPKFEDIKRALTGERISIKEEKKIRDAQWRPVKNKSLKINFASIKNSLKESDIVFYDDGTGIGKTLQKQLKKEQIPFTIKQLNKLTNAAYFDMSSRLSGLGYGNVTLFPVIEIRGEMIMNPSIDDVKTLAIEMIAE